MRTNARQTVSCQSTSTVEDDKERGRMKPTRSKPLIKGPNPTREEGSVLDEMAAIVRPQKFPRANTTFKTENAFA